MRFTCRGKQVAYENLEQVVAIRAPGGPGAARSRSAVLKALRTARAVDDSSDPSSRLPARQRRAFDRAGWIFADSRPSLTEAARTGGAVPGIDIARPVFTDPVGGSAYVGTELVTVQLPPDMAEGQARSRLEEDGLAVVRALPFGENLFEARLPPGRPLVEAVEELQDRDGYLVAEPALLQVLTGRESQLDAELAKQWHHLNAGKGGRKKGADIRSLEAWPTTRGKGVRIAVIDNGMEVMHPFLAGGVVGGGHFTPDGDGGVSFHRFQPGQPFPDHPHGTFCLGMAGARPVNGKGPRGSAPEADLIAIACAPDQVTTQVTLARAVAFAANGGAPTGGLPALPGADVLACSLGADGGDWALFSVLDIAIREAATNGRGGLGLPIFWAVANRPVELERDGVCSHPDVIAVGSSGPRDVRGQCAFGPKLELLAPGVNVFGTTSGGGFGRAPGAGAGTSFACPLVAGVAALALNRHPGMTRDQLRTHLRGSCDQIGGVEYVDGHHVDYGFGRINALKAVQ